LAPRTGITGKWNIYHTIITIKNVSHFEFGYAVVIHDENVGSRCREDKVTPLLHIMVANFFGILVVQMCHIGSTTIRPKAGFYVVNTLFLKRL